MFQIQLELGLWRELGLGLRLKLCLGFQIQLGLGFQFLASSTSHLKILTLISLGTLTLMACKSEVQRTTFQFYSQCTHTIISKPISISLSFQKTECQTSLSESDFHDVIFLKRFLEVENHLVYRKMSLGSIMETVARQSCTFQRMG